MKKFILLFAVMLMQVSALAQNVYAVNYIYVPGQGMVEVESSNDDPRQVDNDGLFGMPVEDFRAMCTDTGGAWDVVSGRHICWCDDGEEFNFPYGCPEGGLLGDVNYEENYYEDGYLVDPDYNDPYGSENDPYYNDYSEQPYYPQDEYYPEEEYNPYAPVPQYNPQGYWDLYGHWSEPYVAQLTVLGILQGYPDGSFRPNAPVTRAEMLKMTMMAAGVYPVAGDEDRNRFFSDLDNWQAPWINAGYRMDIVEGYSGPYSGVRLYKPNNNVNRAEALKLVLASFGRLPLDLNKSSFTDVDGWMVPWVEDAYRIGLVGGETNMRIKPAEYITRGEAAKFIVKMLEYAGDI